MKKILTVLAVLFSTNLAFATFSVSTNSLNFENVEVGQTSAPKSITVQNLGAQITTNLMLPVLANEFSIINNTCDDNVIDGLGNVLFQNTSCVLEITFTPSIKGTSTEEIRIYDTISDNTIVLTGTAIQTPNPICERVTKWNNLKIVQLENKAKAEAKIADSLVILEDPNTNEWKRLVHTERIPVLEKVIELRNAQATRFDAHIDYYVENKGCERP